MSCTLAHSRALLAGVAALALSGPAFAGGFEVREQSAFFQGMSFAGAAAGGSSLSSMFWNPAAAGYVGNGITMESNYSLILPKAELTGRTFDADGPGPGAPVPAEVVAGLLGVDNSVDVARDAIVPASYMAYRLTPELVLAMSMNSQFGLGTEPDSRDWIGQTLGRTSKLFSVNAAPTLAYEIAPGIQVGAGVQVQYIDLKRFRVATGVAAGSPSATLEGDDVGVGFTAGINFRPLPGTSIGVGYRSKIDHTLEGSFNPPGPGAFPISADLETPEKVTLGIRQDVMPGFRLHGTVEWTNWDRLGTIPVQNAPIPTELEFEWDDGWYFALGGEYDYSEALTLRAGIAYEISPIQDATSRLIQLPDNNRLWLSAGASYEIGTILGGLIKDATVDLAYTHIFVEDASFERHPSSSPAPIVTGDVDASVDILSVGLRSKW